MHPKGVKHEPKRPNRNRCCRGGHCPGCPSNAQKGSDNRNGNPAGDHYRAGNNSVHYHSTVDDRADDNRTVNHNNDTLDYDPVNYRAYDDGAVYSAVDNDAGAITKSGYLDPKGGSRTITKAARGERAEAMGLQTPYEVDAYKFSHKLLTSPLESANVPINLRRSGTRSPQRPSAKRQPGERTRGMHLAPEP